VLVQAGVLIDEKLVKLLEKMGARPSHGCVRPSPAKPAMASAAQCYGRDLGRGHRINIGEAVGVIAAQSIGEPRHSAHHAYLPRRRRGFAGGGGQTASKSKSKAPSGCTTSRPFAHEKGHLVAGCRVPAKLGVVDELGRWSAARYKIPYGATSHGER